MIREADQVGDWIATLWWASVLFIAVSVTPFSIQGMRSDGMVLWRLFRKPESMRTMINFLALRTADVNGVRPRDWDPALLKAALSTREDEPYYPMAQIYAWYRCVDQRDEAAGLPYLENALRAAAERGSAAMLRARGRGECEHAGKCRAGSRVAGSVAQDGKAHRRGEQRRCRGSDGDDRRPLRRRDTALGRIARSHCEEEVWKFRDHPISEGPD